MKPQGLKGAGTFALIFCGFCGSSLSTHLPGTATAQRPIRSQTAGVPQRTFLGCCTAERGTADDFAPSPGIGGLTGKSLKSFMTQRPSVPRRRHFQAGRAHPRPRVRTAAGELFSAIFCVDVLLNPVFLADKTYRVAGDCH
jgi:hypothetical protein